MMRSHDTSSELCLSLYGGGVKFLPREKISSRSQIYTVKDVLNFPFNAFFIDRDSMILNMNDYAAYNSGFVSVKDSINKSIRETLRRESVLPILHEDSVVMSSRKRIIVENDAMRLDDVPINGLSVKLPWYGCNNQIIGVFGITIMMKSHAAKSLAESLSILLPTGLLGADSALAVFPGSEINDVYFTEKEMQVAGLLVRGKTAKAIALQVGRSVRTIENHINRMRDKTGCHSKYELIDMLLAYQI